MKRDIEHYVTRVCSCLKQRKPNVVPRAPMENTYTSAPFELVSLDFVHLEKGKGGYEYILVRVDHFTRFGQAHATTNKSAQTAANKLYNDFILQFGFPARILHDKGSDFENQLFHRLEECCGMVRSRKTLTSPKEMGKQSVLTKHFYPDFFRLSFRNCISCVNNCEDLLYIDFFIPQFKYMNFIYS